MQYIADVLLSLGLRLQPQAFQDVMVNMLKLSKGVDAQRADGRTFGIVVIPWGDTEFDVEKAVLQQDIAIAYATKFRQEILDKMENTNAQAL